MPKTFFAFENMTPLSSIPSTGRIHLIGICGVAMGQLAVALVKMGYQVSGSDKEFYEPMGSFLAESSLELFRGYDATNVPKDVDLVVIGNAISYGHPEVAVVEEQDLPYTCFPKLLHESIIAGKHSIVACGTHGKSTTTAMLASTLCTLDADPSYFIGGVVDALPSSLHNGSGSYCAVEGDEYDDVFFSKRAKFLHYQANTCIINAIEFDHADLYDDVEHIVRTFTELVLSLPPDGTLICCSDFAEIDRCLPQWRSQAQCRILTFGEKKTADYRVEVLEAKGLEQSVAFHTPGGDVIPCSLSVPGVFNARNALATYIACSINEFDSSAIVNALKGFRSVRRRQEIRYQDDSLILMEDFAHHPTAVAATLQALRSGFPDKHIRAVFEPRSNTSRRAVFRQDYIDAFLSADSCILSEVKSRATDSGQELLDVHELAADITNTGCNCRVLPDAASIAQELLRERKADELIVVMSNGSFGGLIQLLLDALHPD